MMMMMVWEDGEWEARSVHGVGGYVDVDHVVQGGQVGGDGRDGRAPLVPRQHPYARRHPPAAALLRLRHAVEHHLHARSEHLNEHSVLLLQ